MAGFQDLDRIPPNPALVCLKTGCQIVLAVVLRVHRLQTQAGRARNLHWKSIWIYN
jgi:hypothetical protein